MASVRLNLYGSAHLVRLPFDRLEQVADVIVRIPRRDCRRLLVCEVLQSLLAVEVIFDPKTLAGGVYPLIGVRPVAVHLAPVLGQAAITHEVRGLMDAFRR